MQQLEEDVRKMQTMLKDINKNISVLRGRFQNINLIYIEFVFMSYIILYVADKIIKNAFDLGTLIVIYSVIGFILLINTRHSYIGSLMNSISLFSFILLSIYGIKYGITFVNNWEVIIIFTISAILIYVGHYYSRNKYWPILDKINKSKFLYSFTSYILTVLFMATFYLSEDLPNINYIFISIILLIYIYGVNNVNYCQRENLIQSYIDISNKRYYNEMLFNLLKRHILFQGQIEVTISEFVNSINYFIEGNYKNSILSSYMAIEAFERVNLWSYKINLRETKFNSRRRLIANWRNYIAHSNVEKDYVRDDVYTLSYFTRAFHSILHTYDILRLSLITSFALDV